MHIFFYKIDLIYPRIGSGYLREPAWVNSLKTTAVPGHQGSRVYPDNSQELNLDNLSNTREESYKWLNDNDNVDVFSHDLI